jgi:hypothetical protein
MSNPARLFYAFSRHKEVSVNKPYFSKAISSNYLEQADGSKSHHYSD